MESSSAQVTVTPSWRTKLGSFMVQSKRVWHLLRKPTKEEFIGVAKISALGIVAIGVVGFIISLLMRAVT